MDDPSQDLLIPWVSGVMVSIIAFGKLCNGAQNSRLGTLKWDFENLRIVLYYTEMFSGKYVLNNGEKIRRWIYGKGHCV
jgi:hypothetical protein